MASFIAVYMVIAWVNGFFPVVPRISYKNGHNYSAIYICTSIIGILWGLLPLSLVVCVFGRNELPDAIRPFLALRILFYSTTPMPAISNLLLRFLALSVTKLVQEMIEYLELRKHLNGVRPYSKRYGGVLALFILVDIGVHVWLMWHHWAEPDVNAKICMLPGMESLSLALATFAWLLQEVAPLLGLTFIMLFGLILLELHEGMSDILRVQYYEANPEEYAELKKAEEELGFDVDDPVDRIQWVGYFGSNIEQYVGLRNRKQAVKTIETAWSEPSKKAMALNFEDFSKEFKTLKGMFRRYEQVAGMFAIIIVVSSGASIVQHVGNLAFNLGETEKNIVLLFQTLFYLFIVSHFGEFMSSKVEENRDELRDAMGHFGWDGETPVSK